MIYALLFHHIYIYIYIYIKRYMIYILNQATFISQNRAGWEKFYVLHTL